MVRTRVLERDGYLRNIFSGDFNAPLDAQGTYRLRFPHVTRDDFCLVARYYDGALPTYISPEAAATAVQAAEQLLLPGMVFEVGKRTADLAQKADGLLLNFREQTQKLAGSLRPKNWEVTSFFLHHDRPSRLPDGYEPIFVDNNYKPYRVVERKPVE